MAKDTLTPIEKYLLDVSKELLALTYKHPNDQELGRATRHLLNKQINLVIKEHVITKGKTT